MKKKGIKIEFLSREVLRDKEFEEKLAMIMDKVRENMILVLEEALTNEEKRELITRSVELIDEKFPGIEFSGIEDREDIIDKIFGNFLGLFGRERRAGITIVGNSNVLEKVKEDKDSISLMAVFK